MPCKTHIQNTFITPRLFIFSMVMFSLAVVINIILSFYGSIWNQITAMIMIPIIVYANLKTWGGRKLRCWIGHHAWFKFYEDYADVPAGRAAVRLYNCFHCPVSKMIVAVPPDFFGDGKPLERYSFDGGKHATFSSNFIEDYFNKKNKDFPFKS